MADYTIEPPPAASATPSGASQKYTIEPPSAAPEKVYRNDVGQPFTLSGKPPATPPTDQSYTGSILPLRRDQSGLHLAVPESISSPIKGAIEGGKRALGVGEAGQNPLRPVSPDIMSTLLTSELGRGPKVGEPVAQKPGPVAGVTPERAQLAKIAIDKYKIPVTAPQIGMSKGGQMMEGAIRRLPLSGSREHELKVRQSWNSALAKTFGEDAKALTPSVMRAAKKRLGGEINRIENSNSVSITDEAFNKLAQLETLAHSSLEDGEAAVVSRLIHSVIDKMGLGDELAGTTVGALLRKGAPLDAAIGNRDSNIAHSAQAIKQVIQESLQDSLSADEAEAYRNARFQYKNMKTVEPLVNKAPTGDISPALLNSRVSAQFPNRAYDDTGHDLDDLAKIGQAFLKEPPTSGSAENALTYYGGAKTAELIAAILGGHFLGLPAALGGAGAALGGGRLIGNALRSPRLAQKTINRVLSPAPVAPSTALPRALSVAPSMMYPFGGNEPAAP